MPQRKQKAMRRFIPAWAGCHQSCKIYSQIRFPLPPPCYLAPRFRSYKAFPTPSAIPCCIAPRGLRGSRTFGVKRLDIWMYPHISRNAITGSTPYQAADIVFHAKPFFSSKIRFFCRLSSSRQFFLKPIPKAKTARKLPVLAGLGWVRRFLKHLE